MVLNSKEKEEKAAKNEIILDKKMIKKNGINKKRMKNLCRLSRNLCRLMSKEYNDCNYLRVLRKQSHELTWGIDKTLSWQKLYKIEVY